MADKSSMITECLLTVADFDYIVALNEFNSSKASLLSMKESALALTTVFIVFMVAAAFVVKKTRSKGVKIDILFIIPFVLTMILIVVMNIRQYWSLSNPRKRTASDLGWRLISHNS